MDTSLVLKALKEVQKFHPEVTTVYFSRTGNWQYIDDEGNPPRTWNSEIDTSLLEEARDYVENHRGLPHITTIGREEDNAQRL